MHSSICMLCAFMFNSIPFQPFVFSQFEARKSYYSRAVIEYFCIGNKAMASIVCHFKASFFSLVEGTTTDEADDILLSDGIISFMSSYGPFFIDRHASAEMNFHIEKQFENYLNWKRCLQIKRKEL